MLCTHAMHGCIRSVAKVPHTLCTLLRSNLPPQFISVMEGQQRVNSFNNGGEQDLLCRSNFLKLKMVACFGWNIVWKRSLWLYNQNNWVTEPKLLSSTEGICRVDDTYLVRHYEQQFLYYTLSVHAKIMISTANISKHLLYGIWNYTSWMLW